MDTKRKMKLKQIELKSFVTQLSTFEIRGGQDLEATAYICSGSGVICVANS